MTVLSTGIDTAELKVRKSEISQAIINNDKISDKLPVVMVISNPCSFKRRWTLAKRFQQHMEEFDDVELYCVELIYNDQEFHVTQSDNPNHLQLRTHTSPIWAKETLCNMAVKKLLPKDWKCVAFIDADIEFLNPYWADQTLKILNGCKDVLQLFSHTIDMDANENTMQIFSGFGFQYEQGKIYKDRGQDFFHPGYSLAMTRKAYDKIGGVFEYSILGSGDYNMMMALIGSDKSINEMTHEGYKKKIRELVKNCRNLRLGYVPNVSRHSYHGSKKNRHYSDRWKLLVKHQYDPYEHTTHDENGMLIPSEKCPKELLEDIVKYFASRNEDE